MTAYDPVECLREEVKRFQATNTFSPMLVTNFYAQAACVLTELERARAENSELQRHVKALRGDVKSLERQVDRLETALVDQNV